MPSSSFYSTTQTPASFYSSVINSNTVTRRQFMAAVSNLGDADLLLQAIPANTNDSNWREFWTATFVNKTSNLAQLAKAVFTWSDADLDNCFTIARTFEP